ncbi:hypothetical protein [Chitinophaga ginsengisoli]|uniref:Uncharacterized protein n=1 Tax=Chitinophaga ginsengisoli TaxID=363837 RepID=A0A2P8GLU5_9BACT|nr:hypothetical protein [Chitinophaga ginsengisoli]PSL34941.1 hypothetical protein CLV42_102515 [Chitinophaga ginsengisoli]
MSLLKPMSIFLFLIVCMTASAQTQQNTTDTSYTQKDTAYWVYNFRQFRDAVYQGNKAKARVFVDLPISEESNHIWILAYGGESVGGKAKPFTEADFYKYFNKIFDKAFIKCLLKIKTEELYKTGDCTTIGFVDSLASKSYGMSARWDKESNTLTLNLGSRTIFKEGEEEWVGEFAVIYIFEITKKGHIRFKSVGLAG